MNIFEFIEDPALIAEKSLSPAQRMSLKAVYGLPLTAEEFGIYQKTAGLSEYVPREWPEATFILARRSGKSDKLASNIALYEACAREHKLSVGETGVVMIVSSELKRQSRIVFDYCLGKLERSKVLRRMIKRVTKEEIVLNNGISIQTFPAHEARIRGKSLICFVGDEACWWKQEGKSIDRAVLDAARPGLSFPYSKLIKISTPGMMRGEVWNDYQRYWGKPDAEVLVLQGDIYTFRPDYSERKLEAARLRDPVAFEQEWLARFRTDLSGMYDPAVIDRAVNPDRPLELPFRAIKGLRAAFADVAGGGGRSSYAIAIGRLEDEKIIVEVVRSRAPKFNPEAVTEDYASLLKSYGLYEVFGDKFSGDFILNLYAKFGITYQRAEKSKSELYLEAEGAFNSGLVEIPNREQLITQLKSLVRKARFGGKDSVDADIPEDEPNVVCGLIWLLSNQQAMKPLPISYGLSDSSISDEGRLEQEARDWLMGRQKKAPEKEEISDADLERELMEDQEKGETLTMKRDW
jgi:hypothetical protein